MQRFVANELAINFVLSLATETSLCGISFFYSFRSRIFLNNFHLIIDLNDRQGKNFKLIIQNYPTSSSLFSIITDTISIFQNRECACEVVVLTYQRPGPSSKGKIFCLIIKCVAKQFYRKSSFSSSFLCSYVTVADSSQSRPST